MSIGNLVRDRVLRPQRLGPLENATHYGRSRGGEGERWIALWLQVERGQVKAAAWAANGCSAMIASASAVAELCEGRTASEIRELGTKEIVELIGELPPGREYAMDEALIALKNAIEVQ